MMKKSSKKSRNSWNNKNGRIGLSKRILSVMLTVALVLADICFDDLLPGGGLFHNTMRTVEAAYTPPSEIPYTTFYGAENTPTTTLSLNYNNFKAYAYYYNTIPDFASDHQNDVIILDFGTTDTIDAEYSPLGTVDYPFNGKLNFNVAEGVSYFTLKIYEPLFDYLSDNAEIGSSTVTLNLFNMTTGNVLLANHIKHVAVTDANGDDVGGTADWNVMLDNQSASDAYSSTTSTKYAGVIGEMMDNAKATIRFTDYLNTAVESADDVGMICGTMSSHSSLTVYLQRITTNAYNVTSTGDGKAAGALVGKMNSGASLILGAIPEVSSSSVIKASGSEAYAGGLVGWAEDASIEIVSGGMTVGGTTGITAVPILGSVQATNSGYAGGVFGYYKNTNENANGTYDIAKIKTGTIARGSYVNSKSMTSTDAVVLKGLYEGGVFGMLENTGSFTISDSAFNAASTIMVSLAEQMSGNNFYGGLIGKYTAGSLENTLDLESMSVTSDSWNGKYKAFGGYIGLIDSVAYVKANDVTTYAGATNRVDSNNSGYYAYFGGLVGATTSGNGVLLDVGNITVNTNSGGISGGGIIGQFYTGVLRLSGVTDMTGAKTIGGYTDNAANAAIYAQFGQLVGYNDNTLVYALGDGGAPEEGKTLSYGNGWQYKRSNGSVADDIGTWGEVVRISNIEDSTNGILTFDGTDHTVELKSAVTSMGTPADFVKTALNIQLNDGTDYGGVLKFAGTDGKTALLSGSLSLAADISLSGTGVNGFMRDGSATGTFDESNIGDVGTFTGTFDGNDHIITLATGEPYGVYTAGQEGAGQIYRHRLNGLFSVIGNGASAGTVQNLTISGTQTVRNAGPDGMSIGGIAARTHGSVTLTGITANQTINVYEGNKQLESEGFGKNVGGVIGYVGKDSTGGTINVQNASTISTIFNLSGYHAKWNVHGALIGKIASSNFTVNVGTKDDASKKLTLSYTVSGSIDTNKKGDNADGGGLIGYVIANGTYTNRVININNVEYSGSNDTNIANTNGGGLLGYSWLATNTTIDGLTVTTATITNDAPVNVGAMCYEATGTWHVNSLNVNGLTISGGAGTSLGMIVNKAYNTVSNNTTGLYLDVLASGYTLSNVANAITLPSTEKYDEIAAFTASDAANVLAGKSHGIISVNMNDDRTGTVTQINTATNGTGGKGTYQNQLTAMSSSNNTSRYYYNVDVIESKCSAGTATEGEKLLSWSIRNYYAPDNISSEFSQTSFPSETVDLTGISYYPVALTSSLTISEATNITFDYNGIYQAESSGVTCTGKNSDSYKRDPALSENQHYLMQAGLFTNLSATAATTASNNKLTISGQLKLSGNFLQTDSYKGVLFSGTLSGSLESSSGSIVLDGIKPMKSGSSVSDGFLLINNIMRSSTDNHTPVITLSNVSTTNAYSDNGTTAKVAQSLIGAASGAGLELTFSGIKLDARTNAITNNNAALTAAYGTDSTIFTKSSLLYSLSSDTNLKAVYNYSQKDDWNDGRNVTYGKEIIDSVQYSGKENRYYDTTKYYTNPESAPTESSAKYTAFSTGFIPYVYNDGKTYTGEKEENGFILQEIKVNVTNIESTTGCGTYNHPYVISDGKQLAVIAALIKTPTVTNVYPESIRLPKDKNAYATEAEYASGDRWCESKSACAIYTWDDINMVWSSPETGANDWTATEVGYYLTGAYIQIGDSNTQEITLPENYQGLGGTTANQAFRGVIVGYNNENVTIINPSQKPLVDVTNGCVVKNITVNVTTHIMLSQSANGYNNANFGYSSNCAYYGGIIGEIMGGDNIIDNSYVKFLNNKRVILTNSGENGRIVPVGGYVGVVVFGGLIFKNIDASKTTIKSTGLEVINPQRQGIYTVTFTGNAEVGDIFTVAGVSYTVKETDKDTNGNNKGKITPNTVAARLEKALNGHADYDKSRSNAVLTLTEKNNASKKGIGAPEVSTTSSTTTFTVAMTQDPADGNLADNSQQVAWSAIYVNPLVGRVINGYAVNETGGNAKDAEGKSVTQFSNSEDGTYHDKTSPSDTATTRSGDGVVKHTLKNGKKHYSIADIDPTDTNNSEALKLDVESIPQNTLQDGTINIPNSQAMFILSLITQSTAGTARTADGEYKNSLSYGIVSGSVYGTSHTASYTYVGSDRDSASVSDYTDLARKDTAKNTAVPYIIRHYTKYTNNEQEVSEEITVQGYYINHCHVNNNIPKYFKNTITNSAVDLSTNILDAAVWYFEPADGANLYYLYTYADGSKKYLKMDGGGNMSFTDTCDCVFTLTNYYSSGWYDLKVGTRYLNLSGGQNGNTSKGGSTKDANISGTNYDSGNRIYLTEVADATETKTVTYTTGAKGYAARCVTSTLGYYDINLTGRTSYVLPDSYRGLGSVGYNDDLQAGESSHIGGDGYFDRHTNRYCMKVDVFNGNGVTIDEDIYLNKYYTDNYFKRIHLGSEATQEVQDHTQEYEVNNGGSNKGMHGIGLFDTVVMRNSKSVIGNFDLSGSVNTAVYNNKYATSAQELTGNSGHKNGEYGWLVSGGVVGQSLKGTWVSFDKINLSGLKVRGNSCVGGLLGFSKNSSVDTYIIVTECSADDISIEMSSVVNDSNNPRSAAGAFVGKVYEGGVKIYGTADKEENTDESKYLTVTISGFSAYKAEKLDVNSPVCLGGLVGYAGNGCEVYDMYVESKAGKSITIGNNYARMSGGIVGLVQPCTRGVNGSRARAIFKNCQVKNIDIQAYRYAGGLYGGTTGDHSAEQGTYFDYSTYQIIIQNCKVTGADDKNTVIGGQLAGGFVGDGYVVASGTDTDPNIIISDCVVSNYNVSSGDNGYVGGFIGYCGVYSNGSIVASVYDSSVEDCILGDANDYTGGVVGYIYQGKQDSTTNHKIAGYNVKLDNVTTDPSNSNMGAWIGSGKKDGGATITVQLSGIGIYGSGFTKNIGDGTTLNDASFVFADYDGTCEDYDMVNKPVSGLNCSDHSSTSTTHVEMPKYPYVNVSPQSWLGTNEIISGDGAVLLSSAVSGYAGYTSANTMAAKLYADSKLTDTTATNYSRRYTTFSDDVIADNHKINYYLQKTSESSGNRISTWKTEKGGMPSEDVNDFAMIVITNEDAAETTALISRYIQLVTNTATDYSLTSTYYNIVPSACVYNSTTGNFEITNGTASIAYAPAAASTNAFTVNRDGADSMTANKFTLLDVQFYDPLQPYNSSDNTGKIAYHLYVPVYVVRSISAKFSSTAMSGTNALSSSYVPKLATDAYLAENLDTWVTTYIRYTYTTEDMQALLDAGLLGWNGNKNVILTFSPNATGHQIPNGTQLVLIDPNGDADRAFYAVGSDLTAAANNKQTISLSNFHTSYSGGNKFNEQNFGDIIGGSVSVKEEKGNYDLSDSSDYTVKVEGNYYKFVGENVGKYNITASSDLNEDYYISMLVPSSNYVYLFDVKSPTSLSGSMVTELTARANESLAAEHYATLLLGDLYEYGFTSTSVGPDNQIIADSNNTITVDVTSYVRLKSTNRTFYANALNSNNISLYHADVVTLNRYYAEGSDTQLAGYGDISVSTCTVENTTGTITDMSGKAKADPSSGVNITVKTGDIREQVTDSASSGNYSGATIHQIIVIPFKNIDEEFPSRPADQETQYGVSATVTSNISYGENDLTYSSKKTTYSDTKRYYIENSNSAVMSYKAVYERDEYDSIGNVSYNYSRLGNNGLDRFLTCVWPTKAQGMPINAIAKYNAATVFNYDDAVTIKYQLTLLKKTDTVDENTNAVTSVTYNAVNIDSYLKHVTLYGGSGGTTVLTKDTESSTDQRYVYTEAISSANVDEKLFTIGTYYEVVTGGDFQDYANYKVVLEVSLINGSGQAISNSTAKSFIVYTNAKIYPEVIQGNTGTP